MIILDLIMDQPAEEAAHDPLTPAGVRLFKAIRSRNPTIPIVIYSALTDYSVMQALENAENTRYISKWSSPSIREFLAIVESMLGRTISDPGPQCFIIHGHDESAKLALKNYLQNTLQLREPIILHEQPNLGRTIIDKFESMATNSDLAFALLTPDDKTAPLHANDDVKRRARQNVVFELGYFLGMLGRTSGRVILLYSGPLELPSDLAGLIYIDISHGIEAAGEQIRKEVDHARR